METALTAVGATSKVRPMLGSATFTIVTSMIDMNMTATKTAPTATFWLILGGFGDDVTRSLPLRRPAWSPGRFRRFLHRAQ